jgi:hypothetical protein
LNENNNNFPLPAKAPHSVRGSVISLTLLCCSAVPAARYLSKLTQDKDGKLTTVATEAIKDGPGTWFPCSGTITPWDSHLGSEEYPADCEWSLGRVCYKFYTAVTLSRAHRAFTCAEKLCWICNV